MFDLFKPQRDLVSFSFPVNDDEKRVVINQSIYSPSHATFLHLWLMKHNYRLERIISFSNIEEQTYIYKEQREAPTPLKEDVLSKEYYSKASCFEINTDYELLKTLALIDPNRAEKDQETAKKYVMENNPLSTMTVSFERDNAINFHEAYETFKAYLPQEDGHDVGFYAVSEITSSIVVNEDRTKETNHFEFQIGHNGSLAFFDRLTELCKKCFGEEIRIVPLVDWVYAVIGWVDGAKEVEGLREINDAHSVPCKDLVHLKSLFPEIFKECKGAHFEPNGCAYLIVLQSKEDYDKVIEKTISAIKESNARYHDYFCGDIMRPLNFTDNTEMETFLNNVTGEGEEPGMFRPIISGYVKHEGECGGIYKLIIDLSCKSSNILLERYRRMVEAADSVNPYTTATLQ